MRLRSCVLSVAVGGPVCHGLPTLLEQIAAPGDSLDFALDHVRERLLDNFARMRRTLRRSISDRGAEAVGDVTTAGSHIPQQFKHRRCGPVQRGCDERISGDQSAMTLSYLLPRALIPLGWVVRQSEPSNSRWSALT
jgi:hypothetical protein